MSVLSSGWPRPTEGLKKLLEESPSRFQRWTWTHRGTRSCRTPRPSGPPSTARLRAGSLMEFLSFYPQSLWSRWRSRSLTTCKHQIHLSVTERVGWSHVHQHSLQLYTTEVQQAAAQIQSFLQSELMTSTSSHYFNEDFTGWSTNTWSFNSENNSLSKHTHKINTNITIIIFIEFNVLNNLCNSN